MSKAILDVVVPCFKQGNFLEALLESVARATSSEHKVIVVDDSSPDRITQLNLSKLLPVSIKQELEIVKLDTNSGGVSRPRNIGFETGSSEFVVFLDADDLLVSQSLDIVLRGIVESGADVAIGKWAPFGQNSLQVGPEMSPSIPYSISPTWVYRKWERGLTIPIHSAMFRRSSLNTVLGPFCETYRSKEDFHFWTHYCKEDRKIWRSDVIQALYRTSQKSMSQSNFLLNGYNFCLVAIDLAEQIPHLSTYVIEAIDHVLDFYGNRLQIEDRKLFDFEIKRLMVERNILA